MPDIIKRISPIDKQAGEQARLHIDNLTKPPGSLGRLEELAVELAEITSDPFPAVFPPAVIVMAADHGIAAEGVSAFPQEVTAQMVYNFLNGGAAINVFARQIGASFDIVDMGVAQDLSGEALILRKIRYGTANFLQEPAMTREEALRSIEAGIQVVEEVIAKGAKCIIAGEMGIGNTTSSTAIVAAISGLEVGRLTGKGTGIDEERRLHKQQVIEQALSLRKPDPTDAIDILSKVGGLEIGGMAGVMLGAAAHRIPVLLDGFICTAAALLAVKLCEHAKGYMIAGHLSQEPGHAIALQLLQKRPLVDLNLRLGEGSGAAVSFSILEASAGMVREMATFTSAGVSTKNNK